jgi:hypothetical protein
MPQRKEYMKGIFNKMKINYTFFNAITPKDVTTEDYNYLSVTYDDKFKDSDMYNKPTRLALQLSFTMCFLDAIKNMSVQDGYSILKGAEHAATEYLIKTTSSPLKNKFMPIVKEAISKTKVTAYWEPLANTYNTIPFVKKQNPNLDEYITDKAIAGLMYLIAEEEAKIRKDPMARASELLKKVFGN